MRATLCWNLHATLSANGLDCRHYKTAFLVRSASQTGADETKQLTTTNNKSNTNVCCPDRASTLLDPDTLDSDGHSGPRLWLPSTLPTAHSSKDPFANVLHNRLLLARLNSVNVNRRFEAMFAQRMRRTQSAATAANESRLILGTGRVVSPARAITLSLSTPVYRFLNARRSRLVWTKNRRYCLSMAARLLRTDCERAVLHRDCDAIGMVKP